MFRKVIFTFALLAAISVKAHQPDVSTTMLVEQEKNTWVLQISASLTAFQQEIKTHFYETPYKTPVEFQQMVLEHIKNHLTIEFNEGQHITLSEGVVKLGHETKVVFEVFGVPSEIHTVEVKNNAFKDIHHNQSALVLLKNGFNKEHFVLNDANNHTLNLKADGDKFVEIIKNKNSMFSLKTGLPLISGLLLIFGVVVIRKFKKKERLDLNVLSEYRT